MSQSQIVNLPWIEKYRPKNLNEVIDHQEKITVLRKMIENRELPHLLFFGVPGSGKTSLILAAAREMFGANYRHYILELNASDHRGIEIVRTVIPEFVKTKSDQLRLVILDEADAMTPDAQSALRRVMEIYVKNSRFCLICNNITRIIPGIQSRCARMRFGSLRPSDVTKKVEAIVALEGVKIQPEAIAVLIELNRDFRQVLNTLQCLHYIKQSVCSGRASGVSAANAEFVEEASGAEEASGEISGGEEISGSEEISGEISGGGEVSRGGGAEGVSGNENDTDWITPNDIYDYIGHPQPKEVEEIYNLLLNGQGFHESFQKLVEIFRQNRWNFLDLIDFLCRRIILPDNSLSDSRRGTILRGLSEIESRVVNGRDSELQLASLLALFTV